MLDTIAWQVCKAILHFRKLKQRIVSRLLGDFFLYSIKLRNAIRSIPRERPFVFLREVKGLPDS